MTIEELNTKWWYRLTKVIFIIGFLIAAVITVATVWDGSTYRKEIPNPYLQKPLPNFIPDSEIDNYTRPPQYVDVINYNLFFVNSAISLAVLIVVFWLFRRSFFYVLTGDKFFKL